VVICRLQPSLSLSLEKLKKKNLLARPHELAGAIFCEGPGPRVELPLQSLAIPAPLFFRFV